MLLLLSATVLLATVVVPMLPGLREMRSPRDANHLPIDERYTRDPRYLGRSFREKVAEFRTKHTTGALQRFLSRSDERARIADKFDVPENTRILDVLISKETMKVGQSAQLLDVFASSDIHIAGGTWARAVASDGHIDLGDDVRVARWVDAEQTLRVGRNAQLGQSASAGGTVEVAAGTQFRRIFGLPVTVAAQPSDVLSPAPIGAGRLAYPVPWDTIDLDHYRVYGGDLTIEASRKHTGDDIVHGDLLVRSGAVVFGNLKVHGNAVVEPGATIHGNLICRGNMTIGADVSISGHLFAEGDVTLSTDVHVGANDAPKTIYAAGRIELATGDRIYGWIISEAGGSIV